MSNGYLFVEPTANCCRQTRAPYTPEASPPTPCPATDSITTRSGLSIQKKAPLSKSMRVKGGRVQKKARVEKPRTTTSNIPAKPLSEVQKEFPQVPVFDIEAFVARTTDERLNETSRNKKAGQIKRPMNAFMLYRKTFQEVAKTQCAQNNHQHVSKVCGAAWPLEAEAIQYKFTELAKRERENHQKAHPGYKFTPSKPRKMRGDDQDGDYSVFQDNGDPDWIDHRESRRLRGRQAPRSSETPSLPFNSAYDVVEDPSLASYAEMHAYPNPGQPLPLAYGQAEPSPYSLSTRQFPALAVPQSILSRTPSPGLDYQLHGMGNSAVIGDNYCRTSAPFGAMPSLGMMSNTYSYEGHDSYDGLPLDMPFAHHGLLTHSGGQTMIPQLPEYDGGTAHDAYLRGKQDDWRVEELDEAGQFENWWMQTENGGL